MQARQRLPAVTILSGCRRDTPLSASRGCGRERWLSIPVLGQSEGQWNARHRSIDTEVCQSAECKLFQWWRGAACGRHVARLCRQGGVRFHAPRGVRSNVAAAATSFVARDAGTGPYVWVGPVHCRGMLNPLFVAQRRKGPNVEGNVEGVEEVKNGRKVRKLQNLHQKPFSSLQAKTRLFESMPRRMSWLCRAISNQKLRDLWQKPIPGDSRPRMLHQWPGPKDKAE